MPLLPQALYEERTDMLLYPLSNTSTPPHRRTLWSLLGDLLGLRRPVTTPSTTMLINTTTEADVAAMAPNWAVSEADDACLPA